MILPDFHIRRLCTPTNFKGESMGESPHTAGFTPLIAPFDEDNLCPAGYDLTLDQIEARGPTWCLVSTEETVCIPNNMLAEVKIRSSLARQGWVISAGYIDPGYHGQLTFGMHISDQVQKPCETTADEWMEHWARTKGTFCQIVFHHLSEPCETCLIGREVRE